MTNRTCSVSGVLCFDLDRHQHLLVYGTSRSGKTTVLRTVAAGVIESHTPASAVFYVVDCGGHGLQSLADAPHCGGVMGSDDPGRVARLLRHLRRQIDERKRLLAAAKPVQLRPVARSRTGAPRILVFVDSYAGFTSAFERVDGGRLIDQLHRLVADGPAAGVHLVITADRRAAVPGALASVITSRLVLRMAERDDYVLLGVDQALVRGARLPAGRGFVQGSVEVQVAVASDDPSAQGRAEEIRARALRAAELTTARSPRVDSMPTAVTRDVLPRGTERLVVSLGIGDRALEPWWVDLRHDHLLVVGPPRSGRSTTLRTLASGLLDSDEPPALLLVATRRSPLLACSGWWRKVIDPSTERDVESVLAEAEPELVSGRGVVVLCDDVDELPESVSRALETAGRRGREAPLRLIVAADNRAALRTYAGVIPEVRKTKQGLLLVPDIDIDGELLGVRLRAPLESAQAPGRGFAVRDGVAELLQVAQ
ncbi:MAG: FtsK/SpoIIIE domain-containing protein [Nocardioidaceae bacterium]